MARSTRRKSKPTRKHDKQDEIVHLVGVEKSFGGQPVLRGVDLTVRRGTTYCIIGRSGTGKSVTLKHIVGLLEADDGDVFVFGDNVTCVPRRVMDGYRRRMGYLFQDGALINWMSVEDNVALPLREHERMSSKEIRRRVAEKLSLVGLEGVQQKMPDELSGGMRKRVGLARALIRDPELILYDEPTSGLDPVMANQINALIADLQEKLHTTAIVVTHDMESAYLVGDRIGMLYEGKIIQEGTPTEIQDTDDPVVRQFIEGNVDGPITEV